MKEDLKNKYTLGTIVYICKESSINGYCYIKQLKIIAFTIHINRLIEYQLTEGHTRREQDIITDLDKAKEECEKMIKQKYEKNLEMIEREENLDLLK